MTEAIVLDSLGQDLPELIDIVRGILPSDKYQKLQPFNEEKGGTRETFLADWGMGERKVIVKVDKKPVSPNGEYHVKRGYTTAHEIEVTSKIGLEEAVQHHISPLIDYYEVGGVTVSVEPFFEGSKSLRRLVEEKGRLSYKEVKEIFTQILEAERFLIKDKGLYNRDLNPGNILIREGRNGLEVRITDLANATSIDDVSAKSRPTVGARMITDPFLGEKFTGHLSCYDERSEVYAIGVNLIYALTGQVPFEYDIDQGTVKQHFGGIRSVLRKDGKIDCIAHNWALTDATKRIPWKARKLRDVVHWSMITEREYRLDLDNLIERFNEAVKPSLLESVVSSWKGITKAGLVAVGIAGLGVGYHNSITNGLEAEVTQAGKYHVAAAWDGEDLSVSNNLFTLNVNGFSRSEIGSNNSYSKDGMIKALPGDSLTLTAWLRETPLPNDDPFLHCRFAGQGYIEGYQEENFNVWVLPHDRSVDVGEGGFFMHGMMTLKVPENMLSGTYIVAVDVYTPGESQCSKNKEVPFTFEKEGSLLARKRIPLVVGEVPDKSTVYLQGLAMGFSPRVDFTLATNYPHQIGKWKMVDRDLTYHLAIPELSWSSSHEKAGNGSSIYFRPEVPQCEIGEEYILEAVALNSQGKLSHYSYIPLRGEEFIGNCRFKLGFPRREFSEKIQVYKRHLAGFEHE